MFDGSTQRVGIGETSPLAKLHIKTSSTSNTNQLLLESTDAGATSGPDLALYRNSASPADGDVLGALWFYGNNSTPVQELYSGILSIANDVTDGTEDSEIRFLNMVNGTLQTPMTIDGLNVGIGTASPDRKLHVNSGSTNIVATFESTDATAAISLQDNSTTNDSKVQIRAIGDDFNIVAGGSQRVTVNSSGNVGIGTTSPVSSLNITTTKTVALDTAAKFLTLGLTVDD